LGLGGAATRVLTPHFIALLEGFNGVSIGTHWAGAREDWPKKCIDPKNRVTSYDRAGRV
jgi:hypothetical protein